MSDGLNDELIASAAAVLNPRTVGGRLFGDVGSTLVTVAGRRRLIHRPGKKAEVPGLSGHTRSV